MYSFKKTLSDVSLNGKKVVLRVDLNVPVADNKITDNNRIVQTLPTIQYLLDKSCQVIVLSHFSRIKSLDEVKSGKKSLKLVADNIQSLLPTKKVLFIPVLDFSEIHQIIENNKNVNVFVLENTRYHDVNGFGEVVKWESKNFPALAKNFASLGEVFVNDAFGTSHRSHASNVGIAENIAECCVGFLVEKELKFLSHALTVIAKPKVLILGGSKVSDKLKLIKQIAPKVDKLIIGGGMSYTFLKSMGKNVGKSIVEEEMLSECKSLLQQYKDVLVLPVDHVVASEFKDVEGKVVDADDNSWTDKMALDIGPKTIEKYKEILNTAKVVIWNGPMGVFEFNHFANGTLQIAKKLAEITKNGAYTVIGGGDSAAAADKFNLTKEMSFISTGGGASLAFFEGSPMPGLEAIPNK